MKLSIETNDGEFVAHYSERGLARLDFPGREKAGAKTLAEASPTAEIKRWHKITTKAVKECLAGRAPETLPPMDLSVGTAFQQSVWKSLQRIGLGKTMSYGEVAADIGNPKAVRAVGGACGANPVPVLIPCHRVLAAHQRLGGFGGGLDWKRKLLDRERSNYK